MGLTEIPPPRVPQPTGRLQLKASPRKDFIESREELVAYCHGILDAAVCGGTTGMDNAAERLATLLAGMTHNPQFLPRE